MRRILKVAGLVALAALGYAYLVNPSFAADKAEPPPQKIDANGAIKPIFTGCYGQAHGVVSTFTADSVSEVFKNFGVGAGCDWQVNSAVIGGGVTYDFGDSRELGLNARIGITLNPYLLAYVKSDLRLDGYNPNVKDSIVSLGGGLETFVLGNMTVFFEASKDVYKFGDAKALDESWRILGGARIRF